jgi:type IV pilus assembly protein PilB
MSTIELPDIEPPTAEVVDYPRGLIPPTQRGRSRRLIGDVVVDLGFVRREIVDAAVAMSRKQGRPTGQILIESGAIGQRELARALAERFGVDFIDLSVFEVDMGAVNLIPIEMAKRYQAVPVGFLPDGSILLAMADPTNIVTVDEISMMTGKRITPGSAERDDLTALLGRINHLGAAVSEVEEPEPEPELPMQIAGGSDDAPAIRLVHSIIAQAVDYGASDIHFDPEFADMQVLFRVDGVLSQAATVTRTMAPSVVSRIKIMANLDISERRLPQDGRLTVSVDGRRVDVRIATLPLVTGEAVVMRILDTGAVVRDLDSLGLGGRDRHVLEAAISRPAGTILVTGPTGSGKTTTLYGALGALGGGQRSIITIEDPVESPIPGVKQMQVSNKAGITFATGLRSMLRADPDVMMVGEIRDRETAEIAVQAAITGHLVLSTLHTRDAASTVTRLLDMNVQPFMISAAIDCIVAQRLARMLCKHCKREAQIPSTALLDHDLRDALLYEPLGCVRCGGTGYRGRVGLFEVMPITDDIRQLILGRASAAEITAAAVADGMRTMYQDGLDKVRAGVTSMVEVTRVTSVL